MGSASRNIAGREVASSNLAIPTKEDEDYLIKAPYIILLGNKKGSNLLPFLLISNINYSELP
jgi:hypothetical protein